MSIWIKIIASIGLTVGSLIILAIPLFALYWFRDWCYRHNKSRIAIVANKVSSAIGIIVTWMIILSLPVSLFMLSYLVLSRF